MKLKKIGPQGGAARARRPLRSANAERDAQTTAPATREMIVMMEERN